MVRREGVNFLDGVCTDILARYMHCQRLHIGQIEREARTIEAERYCVCVSLDNSVARCPEKLGFPRVQGRACLRVLRAKRAKT